jgi:3'-5' exoribonuclease
MASMYQGSMQIKMKTLEKVDDSRVDVANFLEASPRNVDEMVKELRTVAAALSNGYLRQLMNAFLDDPSFMTSFKRTPAAKTLHHNYIGGLLEHVVELVALSRDVARHFPSVDLDLLTVGAFLHDIGKVKELAVRKSIEYTTEGRYRTSRGNEMIVEKVNIIRLSRGTSPAAEAHHALASRRIRVRFTEAAKDPGGDYHQLPG